MSRKLLSLLVAVAFVLTTVSTGFAAAVPADVSGTDFVKAVGKMQSLGIMVGDPNGNFRPNDTIKRSEFAKIAVVAAGMSDAATISAGTTQFSDVPADHWASGYINVAAGAGYVKGFAGKFNPDATITYAEAITIICRILGYGPVLDQVGTWPSQYVAKAAQIGVTDGVTSTPTVGATRGNVAKLINNALTIQPLTVDSYDKDGKPLYTVSTNENQQIITKNLKCTKLTVNSGGATPTYYDKLVVSNTPIMQSVGSVGASKFTNGSYSTTMEFADTLNADDYLGMEVKAWYKDFSGTNKVVAVEVQTDSANVYNGLIKKDDTKVKLLGSVNSSYDLASPLQDTNAYVNATQASTQVQLVGILGNNQANATVILDNGKIARMYAWEEAQLASGSTYKSEVFTVKEVTDGYIKAKSTTGAIAPNANEVVNDIKIQDQKDKIATKDLWLDIVKDGKVATIDDIKAGDVITKITNDKHQRWLVTSATVDGTLTAVSGTGADMTLTVGGKDYTLASPHSISNNNGDDFNKDFSSGITANVGKAVTLRLNSVGQVSFIVSNNSGATYYYGIAKSSTRFVGTSGSDTNVIAYKPDGTKVTYLLEDPDNTANKNVALALAAGDLIQYQLTSDGKIKNDTLLKGAMIQSDRPYATGATTTGPTDKSLSLTNATGTTVYGVVSDTVIFDVYDVVTGTGDVKIIPFGSIDSKLPSSPAGAAGYTYYQNYQVLRDGAIAKYVRALIPNAGTTANSLQSTPKGVVLAKGYDADGQTVTVNENGTVKTYKLNTAIAANFNDKMYASYVVGSNGKITSVSKVGTYVYNGWPNSGEFADTQGAVYRIQSIDTASYTIKVKAVDGMNDYMDTGSDIYLRWDNNDIQVYDASDDSAPVTTIKGGLSASALAAGDYVWLDDTDTSLANKINVMIKLKKDNIKKTTN